MSNFFEVGDRVTLNARSPYTKYTGRSKQLPVGLIAKITEIKHGWYRVEWEISGITYSNRYQNNDLLPYIPEKWVVQPTSEKERSILEKYLKEHKDSFIGYSEMWKVSINYYYFFPQIEPNFWGHYSYQSGYEEISFSFFQRFILNNKQTKQMENKKIIGYTIKKRYEKYLSGAAAIGGATVKEFNDNLSTRGWMFAHNCSCKNSIEQVGLLDEWFEPVYKKVEVVERLTIGQPSREVFIFSSGKITYQDRWDISIEHLNKLYNHLVNLSLQSLGEHDVVIDRVHIGCQADGTKVTIDEISKVISKYNALNK